MRKILASESERAMQYNQWKDAPLPMVTVGRVFDITRLVKRSKREKRKLNMLLCHAIGMAAKDIPQFYTVLNGDCFDVFDELAIQVIVDCGGDRIRYCDVPFSENIEDFERDYNSYINRVRETKEHLTTTDRAEIDTSAVVSTELDTVSNQYAGRNNPFLCWGKYRRNWLGRCSVQIFLHFNHIQMDGYHIAAFYNRLQAIINR